MQKIGEAANWVVAAGTAVILIFSCVTTILFAGGGAYKNPNSRAALTFGSIALGEEAGDSGLLAGAMYQGFSRGFSGSTGITLPFSTPPSDDTIVVVVGGTPVASGGAGVVPTGAPSPTTIPPREGSIESHVALLYWLGIDPNSGANGQYLNLMTGVDVERALELARISLGELPGAPNPNPNDLLGQWVKARAEALKPLVDQLKEPLTKDNASTMTTLADQALQMNPRVLRAYAINAWAPILLREGQKFSDSELRFLNGMMIRVGAFVEGANRSDGAILEVFVIWPNRADAFGEVKVLLSAGQLNALLGARELQGTWEERKAAGKWVESETPDVVHDIIVPGAQPLFPEDEDLPLPQLPPDNINPIN